MHDHKQGMQWLLQNGSQCGTAQCSLLSGVGLLCRSSWCEQWKGFSGLFALGIFQLLTVLLLCHPLYSTWLWDCEKQGS